MGMNKAAAIDIMNDAEIVLQLYQSTKQDYRAINFGVQMKQLLQHILQEMKDEKTSKNPNKLVEKENLDEIKHLIISVK